MKIRSRSRFSDELTITSGARSMTLQVDLDLTECAGRLRKAREELAEAQDAAVQHPSEAANKAYGQALRRFIAVIFGAEQTDRLVDFYEGQPRSLIGDVMPYIFRRIVPLVQAASRRRMRQIRREARR